MERRIGDYLNRYNKTISLELKRCHLESYNGPIGCQNIYRLIKKINGSAFSRAKVNVIVSAMVTRLNPVSFLTSRCVDMKKRSATERGGTVHVQDGYLVTMIEYLETSFEGQS
ncbi:MAG: hypothetical protein QS748_02875 [Candidatus Endonucleobacter bathymodioli]|uniref:Uncharacterized protein n=1 Tax=Candidatus Endonucleibacter bathymodioli TaxID=539814 RepID=A0AA90NRZ1_9GAMM|nr:hypothetical protein [Candidatus Endonucleobacter bathymodioli]